MDQKLNDVMTKLPNDWRMNINNCTFQVNWSVEDSEYVGLCAEFPSLSWLASTPEQALRGIRRTVGAVLADMKISLNEIGHS